MAATSKRKSFFQKRVESFSYAWKGVRQFMALEVHAKIHIFAASVALFLAGYFEVERWEWVAIIICIVIVIAGEMLNSAVERVVDILFPNQHKKAEVIKDLSAGAVLILAVGAFLVGCIVFLPYLLNSLE